MTMAPAHPSILPCSCSDSVGEGPTALAAPGDRGAGSRPQCWKELTLPRPQNRQADNQQTISSGWTRPLLGPPSPGRGHRGWCPLASLCPGPVLEVGERPGPSPESPCKHFTSCPSLALTLSPLTPQRSL